MGRISPNYFVQDGVIPRTKLPEVLERIDELAQEYGLIVANVFHAGDGNLHPLVCYDGRVEGEAERAEELSGLIIDACLDAGGSITGEHGVGVDKKQHMPKMFGEPDLDAFQRLRCAFDPAGLANPGKVMPTPRLCGEVPGPTGSIRSEAAGRWRSGSELAGHRRRRRRRCCATARSRAPPCGRAAAARSRGSPRDEPSRSRPAAWTASSSTTWATSPRCSRPACRSRRRRPRSPQHGQMLALDPPGDGGGATIGGIVATGDSGPLRHRYGGVRDLVVGITVVLSDGTRRQGRRQGDQERRRLRPRQAVHRLVRHARADRASRGAPAPAARPDATARDRRERRPRAARAPPRPRSPAAARGRRARRRLGGRHRPRCSCASAAPPPPTGGRRERCRALGPRTRSDDRRRAGTAQRAPSAATTGRAEGLRPPDRPAGRVRRAADARRDGRRARRARALAGSRLPSAGPVAAVEALATRCAAPCMVLDAPSRRRATWGAAAGRAGGDGARQGALRPGPDLPPGRLRGRDLMTADDRLGRGTARPDPDLIRDCVHCGFCLPTCPSYAVFEEEMDSPRGRIVLMRIGHEEGEISPEMVTHFDRCLGCMACVTACPSGVQYDKLIERARPQIERQRAGARRERAVPAADLRAVHASGRLRALAPVLALSSARANGARARCRARRLPDAAARAARAARRRAAITPLPRGTPARASARPVALHAGLHPARLLRRRQRGHRARAGRRGLRRSTPRAPALLRRAADARGRRGRGARARPRRRSPPTRASTSSSSTSPAAARR